MKQSTKKTVSGTRTDHPLAIVTVPAQEWGELYSPEEALQKGTLFPDLDKPFFGGEKRGAKNGKK